MYMLPVVKLKESECSVVLSVTFQQCNPQNDPFTSFYATPPPACTHALRLLFSLLLQHLRLFIYMYRT